tara:strand:- start:1922 stop:2374 length:453 start_codon:yes stop_codon:yes gene_type:complete
MLSSQRAKALQLLSSSRPNDFLLCRDVEAACHSSSSAPREYLDRVLKCAFNLKENPSVGAEVVHAMDASLTTGTLVGRIEEERKARDERFQRMLQEKYDSLNDRQYEAIVRCNRCKSGEVRWEEKQTRSADESATIYCICTNCKLRWVMK